MINKQESIFKSHLMTLLRQQQGFVALRHEDSVTSGIPDISLTGYAKTSWWEVKHATPSFDSPLIQELTCLRLAATGYCRYIIFYQREVEKHIFIVHPKQLKTLDSEASCIGFDHTFVIDFMKKVHSPDGKQKAK